MRTVQVKKQMQAKESVEMTVEDLTVLQEVLRCGLMFIDNHYFYDRYNRTDVFKMSTGHNKTTFELDRPELWNVITRFNRQFMDAVMKNVEDVVF